MPFGSRRDVLKKLSAFGLMSLVPFHVHAQPSPGWQLGTFQLDVTPPVGHPLLGNLFAPSTSVLDPLEARGLVFVGPEQPIVVIAIDWCELRNDAFDRWRTVLAESAETVPERVLVHTVHQHDAPYFDLNAQKILAASKPSGRMLDADFHEDCVQRAAAAVKAALTKTQRVTQVGTGQAKVDQLASNRRVDENGKVSFRRYSRCLDPALRALPEGEIDPWLKTISFWNGDQPIAALSVYACHPMSNYGNGEISGDFPNMARRIRDVAQPGTFQIYASGCCGDVTAGKFNDGAKGNREAFAQRLANAMTAAAISTKKYPLNEIKFKYEKLVLPHSELDSMREQVLRSGLDNPQNSLSARVQFALGLSSLTRHPDGQQIDIPMLDFGCAQLLLLPAESFVAYQLFAQQQRPDSFVIVMGFGESAPGYIPTDQAFQEGFREEHRYTWGRPGAEALIKAAVSSILNP